MTLPELPPSSLRLRLDPDALAHNWRLLDRLSGSGRAGAAVKADAYGLGVDNVVPVLREAGAEQFFVAHWSEVPALLRHVPPSQISVLDRKSTRLNSSHVKISYAVFCLK